MTCLIPKKGEGVLVTLENQYPNVNANQKMMSAAHRLQQANGSVVSSTTAQSVQQQQEQVRREDGLP